jgi:hypothetical protein
MPNVIRIKRSAVSSKVPAVGDLQLGELAVNTFDGKLYTKKDNGTASIVEIGGTAGGVTSFSAGTTGLTPSTASTGAITLAGTLAVANGGTGVTTSTGSGSTVRSTSPTLVTPLLGTPTSGTLTNCTGYTFANIASKPTTLAGYGITDAPTTTGTGASGTWGISVTGSSASCTGNAATATTATNLSGFTNSNSSNQIAGADALTNNGIGYVNSVSLYGQSDGALYGQAYSSSWIHQIYGDYRTGQIAVRGRNNGTWQAWRAVLDASNYTSYAPTLTGTGASGTWGISITGSAATLTTARTINGTSFNGSANITTSSWGTARTLSYTGDATGSGSVDGSANASIALTLANSGVTANSYGSATVAPVLTVDAKGRITAASTATIAPAFSSITSKPTTLSGYGITNGAQAGAAGAIVETANTISANYTLSTNFNGMSVGPITIANGATVTVPSGASWVIV